MSRWPSLRAQTTAVLVAGIVMAGLYPCATRAGCESRMKAGKPVQQFKERGDSALLDTQTGLLWQKCSVGLSGTDCTVGVARLLGWKEALEYANTNMAMGYDDWRLPNVKELASLVEKACFDPAINSQVFPRTEPAAYWTSTPYVIDRNEVWVVEFEQGRNYTQTKSATAHIRLVRGGY